MRGGIAVAGGFALFGVIAVTTYPLWRAWCLTWGATREEAVQP